jgi:imidazolonepropionase-like amidohydrolase
MGMLRMLSGQVLSLAAPLAICLITASPSTGQPHYDLLLKGGHVIDAKNNVDRVADVGIVNGKVARIAENIPVAEAKKALDVTGLYVTPGLVDIHYMSAPAPEFRIPMPATGRSTQTAIRPGAASPPFATPDLRDGGTSRTSSIAIVSGSASWPG